MPLSTSSSERIYKLPWGLIITLVAVATIESSTVLLGATSLSSNKTIYAGHKVPSMDEIVVQLQVTYAMASTEPIDIVTIGDSSCLMGIRPKVLEDTTGRTAINLGTVATLYSDGHADLLEEFIRQRGTPKVVVYHMSAIYGIGYYSAEDIGTAGLLLRYRLWRGIKPERLIYAVPSIRRFRQPLQHRLQELLMLQNERRELLRVSRGPFPPDVVLKAMVEELGGGMIEPEKRDWTQVFSEEMQTPHFNKDMIPGLRRIAAMAETYKFDLVIALNPIADPLRSEKFELAFAEYMGILEKELPAVGRTQYLTPNLRYYSGDVCGTVCHLSDVGAKINSRQIGEWLMENVFI